MWPHPTLLTRKAIRQYKLRYAAESIRAAPRWGGQAEASAQFGGGREFQAQAESEAMHG